MKIDRLIGILSILLQKETITAPVLAEQFEVSRRTISRDIDTLCQAGIPIVTRQGINGGISMIRLPEFVTREVFDWAVREAAEKKKQIFPKQNFSRFVKDSVYNVCIQGVMTMNLRPYRK